MSLFPVLPSSKISWSLPDYRLPNHLQDDLSKEELQQFNSRIKPNLWTSGPEISSSSSAKLSSKEDEVDFGSKSIESFR